MTPDTSQVAVAPDTFLSVAEAAKYLGFDRSMKWPEHAVRALVRKRRLRSARVGGRLLLRRSWLDEMIAANTVEPLP